MKKITLKRGELLASVSAMALLGTICGAEMARAGDADRPTVWMEVGWHYERDSGQDDIFAPAFLTSTPRPAVETFSPLSAQRLSVYSYGADGKISFQPEDADWIFSASMRYGRAHGQNHKHHQTDFGNKIPIYLGTQFLESATFGGLPPRFVESQTNGSETHAVADFQAGKDVGLGMFGKGAKSVISAGVRFAQFKSSSATLVSEDPDAKPPHDVRYPKYRHINHATAHAERSFRGVGPSISWDASLPLAGTIEDGEMTFDWGANAALLFGRQKTKAHHQATYNYYKTGFFIYPQKQAFHTPLPPASASRSCSVSVPNLGGFAAVSYRFSDAKLSLGYRADFFFGAIDGGIDTRREENRGFYGPYASVSVGIGY